MALRFPEDTISASRYVKKAIPMMVKNNIVPNPCNFALWYTYYSNRDQALSLELDQQLEKSGTCPPNIGEKLFEKYVVKDEVERQKSLQSSLENVIQELIGDAKNTRAGTDSYSKDLEESLALLSHDNDPEKQKATIEKLITATKETNSTVDTFQKQMEAAEAEINTLRVQLEEQKKDAITDQLTKIANRRAFDAKLFELIAAGKPTTLVLIDLDHFKQLNDNYGHLIGDKVLQGVGELMRRVCPDNALAARYGGEEFAFLLEGDINVGSTIAETLRSNMKKLSLKKKASNEIIDNITASFGVAQRMPEEYPEQLIERADKALYEAKESGRDRVATAA